MSLNNGKIIDSISGNVFKTEMNANPISPIVYCADPTAVEYNGRLYVYGTNDHEQYDNSDHNSYEFIKSFVVFSTEDMANWVYHGTINVGEIAPWIINSWAPSIVSRVEEDGLTHFYLYFSNSGAGVGVITSTDPLGPWNDPLGKPLIYQNMPGLKNCPAPFDPGVCIDGDGVGWLSFGGGVPSHGEEIHSHVPKIVRLGKDMVSLDSEFVSIDAPYFFEASELNFVDGTYYYTFCNDWQDRSKWDRDDIPAPPICSMAYFTTKTPLDADSWKYRGAYLYNAGDSGMRWCNNHTHFLDYKGTYYVIHHTMILEELQKKEGGFRSIMVDKLPIDTKTGEIQLIPATNEGVAQIESYDPYSDSIGSVMFTSADIGFEGDFNPAPKSLAKGAWIYIKGADFSKGASEFVAKVKGRGTIEARLDDVNSEAVAAVKFDCEEYTNIRSAAFAKIENGKHDIYLLFSDKDIMLKSWTFFTE